MPQRIRLQRAAGWRLPATARNVGRPMRFGNPFRVDMISVKADQSRGVNDPGQAPRERFTDESRIRRLAQSVLDR